jgi:hypothetical protein
VHMCSCLFMSVYVHVCAFVFMCVCVHVRACVFICVHVCACAWVCVCVCAWRECMFVCEYGCARVWWMFMACVSAHYLAVASLLWSRRSAAEFDSACELPYLSLSAHLIFVSTSYLLNYWLLQPTATCAPNYWLQLTTNKTIDTARILFYNDSYLYDRLLLLQPLILILPKTGCLSWLLSKWLLGCLYLR